jgi:predicted outer membrane repeat protein
MLAYVALAFTAITAMSATVNLRVDPTSMSAGATNTSCGSAAVPCQTWLDALRAAEVQVQLYDNLVITFTNALHAIFPRTEFVEYWYYTLDTTTNLKYSNITITSVQNKGAVLRFDAASCANDYIMFLGVRSLVNIKIGNLTFEEVSNDCAVFNGLDDDGWYNGSSPIVDFVMENAVIRNCVWNDWYSIIWLEAIRVHILFNNMTVYNTSGWNYVVRTDGYQPHGVQQSYVLFKSSSFKNMDNMGVFKSHDSNDYGLYVEVNFTNCIFDKWFSADSYFINLVPSYMGVTNINNCSFSNFISDVYSDLYVINAFNPDCYIRSSTFTNMVSFGSSGWGALIYEGYSYYTNIVVLEDSKFNDIYFLGGGSILLTYDGRIPFTVKNCKFSNVTSLGSYGAMFSIYSYQVPALIQNSSFHSITGTIWLGYYEQDESSTVTFRNCSFTNLTTTSNTGAVFQMEWSEQAQSIQIVDSTISSASISGLVSLYPQANLTMIGTTVFNIVQSQSLLVTNQANSISIVGCQFRVITSSQGGAVIYLQGVSSIASINSSLFSNISADGMGGSVFAMLGTSLTIIGSQFLSNQATSHAGAVYFQGGILSVKASSFKQCTSEATGGAFRVEATVSSNFDTSSFFENLAEAGGAIYLTGQSPSNTFRSCQFVSNSASGGNGGALFADDQTSLTSISPVTTFQSNSAILGGGLYSISPSVQLESMIFRSNSAHQGGGAYFDRLPQHSSDLQFLDNIANFSQDMTRACPNADGSGGGAFIEEISMQSNLDNSLSWVFSNNFADHFGGGLAFLTVNATRLSLDTILSAFSFYQNEAGYGQNVGAPWFDVRFSSQSMSNLYLKDSIALQANFADSFGQAAFGDSCELSLRLVEGSGVFALGQKLFVLSNVVPPEVHTLVAIDSGVVSPPNPIRKSNASVLISAGNFILDPIMFNFTLSCCQQGQILVGDATEAAGRFKCQDCTQGKYADYSMQTSNISQCINCPIGLYSSSRSWFCSSCPAGSYSAILGAYICPLCAIGSYSPSPNSTTCKKCPENSFSGIQGQSNCTVCPFNSVNYKNGSSTIYDCICPIGWFGEPWLNQSACQVCFEHEGSSCKFNNSLPYVSSGYYRNPNNVVDIEECVPKVSCKEIGESVGGNCAVGYTGNRCGLCASGYYRLANECFACVNKSFVWTAIVVTVVLMVVWLGVRIARPQTASRIDLKIVVIWLQSVAVFSRLPSTWPSTLQRLMSYLSFFVSFSEISSFC